MKYMFSCLQGTLRSTLLAQYVTGGVRHCKLTLPRLLLRAPDANRQWSSASPGVPGHVVRTLSRLPGLGALRQGGFGFTQDREKRVCRVGRERSGEGFALKAIPPHLLPHWQVRLVGSRVGGPASQTAESSFQLLPTGKLGWWGPGLGVLPARTASTVRDKFSNLLSERNYQSAEKAFAQ